eukprot:TRINITY_DN2745_c0_g1_i2.p1 TRINITY_DN2745_c0_g1~~TRINITY_DN2745_c0_g1_i2.p1  ORF type:complete len:711 (+),score=126.66 TRINITY_DN2745_c0_g1_i2:248-2380(+)
MAARRSSSAVEMSSLEEGGDDPLDFDTVDNHDGGEPRLRDSQELDDSSGSVDPDDDLEDDPIDSATATRMQGRVTTEEIEESKKNAGLVMVIVRTHKIFCLVLVFTCGLALFGLIQFLVMRSVPPDWQLFLFLAAAVYMGTVILVNLLFWLGEKFILIPAGLLFFSQGFKPSCIVMIFALTLASLLSAGWPWNPETWVRHSFWLAFTIGACGFVRIALLKYFALSVLKDSFFTDINSSLRQMAVLKRLRAGAKWKRKTMRFSKFGSNKAACSSSAAVAGLSTGHTGANSGWFHFSTLRASLSRAGARCRQALGRRPDEPKEEEVSGGSHREENSDSAKARRMSGKGIQRMSKHVKDDMYHAKKTQMRKLNEMIHEVQEGMLSPHEPHVLEYKKLRSFRICWGNLTCNDENKKKVFYEDFGPFFPAAEQEEAWAMFDTHDDGYLNREDFRTRVNVIFDQRNYLANQLQARQNILNVIDTFLAGVFWILMFILGLLWFGVDFFLLVVPLASVMLAFSFAFGNSLKNIFDSFVLVVFIQPYDVGDRVRFHYSGAGGDTLIVDEIQLLETKFFATDGRHFIIPNYKVYNYEVINLRRSRTATFEFGIEVSATTTADELRQVHEACLSFIRSKAKHYKPVLDYYITDIADNTKIEVKFWFQTMHIWQMAGDYLQARTQFALFLQGTLNQMGIRYTLPTQELFVDLTGGPAKSLDY